GSRVPGSPRPATWSRRSALAAASPTRRATWSRRPSSASLLSGASWWRTRQPASAPVSPPGCAWWPWRPRTHPPPSARPPSSSAPSGSSLPGSFLRLGELQHPVEGQPRPRRHLRLHAHHVDELAGGERLEAPDELGQRDAVHGHARAEVFSEAGDPLA